MNQVPKSVDITSYSHKLIKILINPLETCKDLFPEYPVKLTHSSLSPTMTNCCHCPLYKENCWEESIGCNPFLGTALFDDKDIWLKLRNNIAHDYILKIYKKEVEDFLFEIML